ncbi:MAG TPA: dTDP-4-dehydrorhamnose 3,5-epimerase family protein [Candidatus Saccharimonadales bacterium]|nr:dTDP-4-dehydrorhamnose 3,5-epimerase family protein [Candidatus Saccharimonadales bacterium]
MGRKGAMMDRHTSGSETGSERLAGLKPHGGAPMIDGADCRRLAVIPDERGRLMEMLRKDDPIFKGFGQAYLTAAYPGAVKGWHYHKVQWDHFIVVKGMMKIVLYDPREGSPTRGGINEFFLGDHNPAILQIPPFVYHGFKCISEAEALVVNIPSEAYRYDQPDEFRVPPHDNEIPYDWSRKDG